MISDNGTVVNIVSAADAEQLCSHRRSHTQTTVEVVRKKRRACVRDDLPMRVPIEAIGRVDARLNITL